MIDFNADKQDFESTGNPLYAWEHIHRAVKGGYQPSEWAMEYLGRVAEGLLAIKPKDNYRVKIKNAMGFHDCKYISAFHRQPTRKVDADVNLARSIYERVEAERKTRPWGNRGLDIYEDIAVEFYGDNVKAETVKRIHNEWGDQIKEVRKATGE